MELNTLAKLKINPNCSETINKLEVTDEEKKWLEKKANEMKLTKDPDETGLICFLSETEKKNKVDTGQWMNQTFDERWRDFTLLKTLLLIRRDEIKIGPGDLSKKEQLKKSIDDEELVIRAFMGTEIPYSPESAWKELHSHLEKYFKLQTEL